MKNMAITQPRHQSPSDDQARPVPGKPTACAELHRPLRVLQIFQRAGVTSAPYNEHVLPLNTCHDVTACTYAPATVPVPDNVTMFSADGTLSGFCRAIRAALRERQYDVIHAHDALSAFLFLLAAFFTRAKVTRNTIFTVHSSFDRILFKRWLLLLPVFAAFGKIVFCCRASENSFRGVLRYLSRNKSRAISNGVDFQRIDRFLESRPAKSPSDTFTMIWIGRFIPLKNPETILRVCHALQCETVRLVLVGEGPLRAAMDAEISALGLDSKVTFAGVIPREEVFASLSKADLFVSTSTTEGLPVAVVEALACGCPSVLSDIPSHREIAETEPSIRLVNPTDVEGFVGAIQAFMEMPVSERSAVGEQCKMSTRANYSLEVMTQKYEEFYRYNTQLS